MKIFQPTRVFLVLVCSVLLASCTTQKRKDEQGMLSKLWHNTTAHFNGYFNAEELLEASVLQLEEQQEDNYNKLLPMYEYTAADNPQAVAENLDEAKKKVTVVVNLHPYSNWTDDCYLLAGKADYLKQDYESAEKTFRYLMNEYSPQDLKEGPKEKKGTRKKVKTKKERAKERSEREKKAKDSKKARVKAAKQKAKDRKKARKEAERERAAYNKAVKQARKKGTKPPKRPSKKSDTPTEETPADEEKATKETPEEAKSDEETPKPMGMVTLGKNGIEQIESDPESYFLKHRPAYQEGVYWLARTLIERDNYDGAGLLLAQLEKDKSTFDDVRREVTAAQAYLAIQQRDYDVALARLDQAIETTNEKSRRARYAYIKAQIHQKRGESQAAYAAFEQVIKSKPTYVMEFGARLNMAQNAWLSGQGSAEDAVANLERMLKDEKNMNYRDQVYYAMADIALRQGQREEGIKLLEESLAASVSNRSQQAEAYYRLANLYFEEDEFVNAKKYFDLTLTAMGPSDERYKTVERYRDNLTDIANNIELIALQDSLLRIAEMSDADKRKLAVELLETQQQNQAMEAAQQKANQPQRPATVARPALQKESSFFAYNDKAMRRGQREFVQTWGDRQLEDNWRRSNRRDATTVENELAAVEETYEITDEELEKVLSDVPQTDEDKSTAQLTMQDAMFDLGRLYRDRLENNKKSVEVLEQLDQRFPGNNHELESWYYLYLAHTDLKQTSRASTYKQKIVSQYPESHFAKMLSDPNYAVEFMSEERKLAREYDATYDLFKDGSYELVYSRAEQAMARLQQQHTLTPKYALLRAMSMGKVDGKDAYVRELRKVVAGYPETPEQTRAKEILRLLGESGARLPGEVAAPTQSNFKANPEELHYMVIVFRNADIDLNANKIALSNYNRKYHKLDKIRISNVYLGTNNDIPVLVMRRFKNQESAMLYYDGVQKNGVDFIDAAKNPYDIYPVTQSNYRQILTARTAEGYTDFFSSNYLNR